MKNHQTKNDSINVVIVGSGHGIRVHLPALRKTGFNVVGLVGKDAERTLRRATNNDIPLAFTNLKEALKVTGANAVTIASTPAHHGDHVATAIEHGCHVMCEKPFAKNTQQAIQLANAATNAKTINILGHQLRALPERIVAEKTIKAGALGKISYATFVQHINMLADPNTPWPAWWFNADEGGGWLGASGSHMVDQIRHWLGEFASVSASTQIVSGRDTQTEDSYSVHFVLTNGISGIFTQTAAAWGPMAQMTKICGSEGTLWLDNGQVHLANKNGTQTLDIPSELYLEKIEPFKEPHKRFLHVELPPTLKLFSAWKKAIEEKTDVAPFANFNDGLAIMKIIDAIKLSAANKGKTIEISH